MPLSVDVGRCPGEFGRSQAEFAQTDPMMGLRKFDGESFHIHDVGLPGKAGYGRETKQAQSHRQVVRHTDAEKSPPAIPASPEVA